MLEGFFDRFGRNHENFLYRLLALYISFDAEFNAVSENVHGFGYLLNIKGVRGQKTCFWELFWGFFAERSKLR